MRRKSSLIEEGSYGCAFTPALPCKHGVKKEGRTVGKVMQAKYAEVELKVVPIVQSIPGWKRYFILQEEDTCSIRNFAEIRKTYEKNCKIIEQSSDIHLIQLLSPYGGQTLFDTPIDASFDFIESFRHVLEGIEALNAQGVCHWDIKDNNILVDSAGTLRLIDFGQSFLGDSITEAGIQRHQYTFEPEYWPHPPEISVQNGIQNHLPLDLILRKTVQQKSTFRLIQSILGIPMTQCEDELRRFWREQEEFDGRSWIPFFKTYWRTWDAWAVGAVFIRILQKCFLQKSFVEGVWKHHASTIRHVLKGLLEPDPRKRLFPAGAVDMLSRLSSSP